ncbi:hypothetical protein [Corynebacterium lubricantis]|uniref:hypothetical protein n=1 Tax=Corynebacterium lubricantis TaxID=541095 RepID=UPI00036CADBD|nr:hypothetical protein [Corynebacterium lubricantis]
MTNKAGIFSDTSGDKWVWDGNELFDSYGRSIAQVRSDVLIVGGRRLLIEYSPGPQHFTVRATSDNGKLYRMVQVGFTISHLEATCDGRKYLLDRTQWWSKQREITDTRNNVVATVRPLISGKVEVLDGPAVDDAPPIDLVFMTWGLVLVDSPVRRTLT